MPRRAPRNFHEPGLGSRTGLRISTSVRPDDVQAYYEAGKRFMEPPEPTPPSRLGTPSSLFYDGDDGDECDNGENEHDGRIQPPLTFEQAMELDAHRLAVGEQSFVGVSLMDIQTSEIQMHFENQSEADEWFNVTNGKARICRHELHLMHRRGTCKKSSSSSSWRRRRAATPGR